MNGRPSGGCCCKSTLTKRGRAGSGVIWAGAMLTLRSPLTRAASRCPLRVGPQPRSRFHPESSRDDPTEATRVKCATCSGPLRRRILGKVNTNTPNQAVGTAVPTASATDLATTLAVSAQRNYNVNGFILNRKRLQNKVFQRQPIVTPTLGN